MCGTFCIILVFAIVIIAVICLGTPSIIISGGRATLKKQHIVVDLLNLTHYHTLKKKIQFNDIIDTINATAPVLHSVFPERIMYVVKDPENRFNTQVEHKAFADVAIKNKIYVFVVERYVVEPSTRIKSDEHGARGRDDFYLAVLAHKWRCPVLTEDRFRDFATFKAQLAPFHVLEYTFWSDLPVKDYVRTDTGAFRHIKKPRAIRFAEIFNTK